MASFRGLFLRFSATADPEGMMLSYLDSGLIVPPLVFSRRTPPPPFASNSRTCSSVITGRSPGEDVIIRAASSR